MSRLDDINLKGQIVSILRTDTALHKVNFHAGQFIIGTMHFHILAGYIDIGRCHCSVNPAGVIKGAAAEYDPSSNTIIAKDSRIQFFDDKVSLVHEATHAVVDLLGGFDKSKTVTSLETETCAYIAGAMYKLATLQSQKNSGVKVTVFSKDQDIHNEADKLVKGKGLGTGSTNADAPISFSLQEIVALQSAIKANPLYKDWKSKTVTDGM
jgi:hypothetical protein